MKTDQKNLTWDIKPHIGGLELPPITEPIRRDPKEFAGVIAMVKKNREALEQDETEKAYYRYQRHNISQ